MSIGRGAEFSVVTYKLCKIRLEVYSYFLKNFFLQFLGLLYLGKIYYSDKTIEGERVENPYRKANSNLVEN